MAPYVLAPAHHGNGATDVEAVASCSHVEEHSKRSPSERNVATTLFVVAADQEDQQVRGEPAALARLPAPFARPATFRVGARIAPVNGGGKLTITPGEIVFEPNPITRRLTSVARIVHTSTSVTLVRARLVPPWFNVSLGLHGEERSCYVTTWQPSRRRLRDALRTAGFDVAETSTWFSLRGDVRRSNALPGRVRIAMAGYVLVLGAVGAIILTVSHASSLFLALLVLCAIASLGLLARR